VIDEVCELLDVKDDLVEERDVEIASAELRSIDSGHEVFQILANTSELEHLESREDNTC
jgi:hypothetical protein